MFIYYFFPQFKSLFHHFWQQEQGELLCALHVSSRVEPMKKEDEMSVSWVQPTNAFFSQTRLSLKGNEQAFQMYTIYYQEASLQHSNNTFCAHFIYAGSGQFTLTFGKSFHGLLESPAPFFYHQVIFSFAYIIFKVILSMFW